VLAPRDLRGKKPSLGRMWKANACAMTPATAMHMGLFLGNDHMPNLKFALTLWMMADDSIEKKKERALWMQRLIDASTEDQLMRLERLFTDPQGKMHEYKMSWITPHTYYQPMHVLKIKLNPADPDKYETKDAYLLSRETREERDYARQFDKEMAAIVIEGVKNGKWKEQTAMDARQMKIAREKKMREFVGDSMYNKLFPNGVPQDAAGDMSLLTSEEEINRFAEMRDREKTRRETDDPMDVEFSPPSRPHSERAIGSAGSSGSSSPPRSEWQHTSPAAGAAPRHREWDGEGWGAGAAPSRPQSVPQAPDAYSTHASPRPTSFPSPNDPYNNPFGGARASSRRNKSARFNPYVSSRPRQRESVWGQQYAPAGREVYDDYCKRHVDPVIRAKNPQFADPSVAIPDSERDKHLTAEERNAIDVLTRAKLRLQKAFA
jgi:hypothetical protein